MQTPRCRWLGVVAMALALLSPLPASAVQPDEILADPKLESRARELGRELRCMVCQNQSIDDSDAPLARDLRLLVRERLTAGDSNKQVLDFLTARYGPFVLLKPPFEWSTALLWFSPALVLVIGAGALVMMLRRRAAGPGEVEPAEPQLSAAENKRLAELLGKGGRTAKR